MKLRRIGLKQSCVRWFDSYLHGREQLVKHDNIHSDTLPVNFGVPQGSILGPLLFVIFINDMPDYFNAESLNLYADDTAISIHANDPEVLELNLNHALQKASSWLCANKLTLNVTKTSFMIFGTLNNLKKYSDISVSLENSQIERSSKFKYLGVILDPYLTFTHHVDYLISKSIGRLKMFSKTRPVVSTETSLMLYKTVCAPVFDYCDIIYDCLSQKNSNRLQKLQNSALRIISQSPRHISSVELHAQYKLDFLVTRRHKHCCHYAYKGLNDMCPPNFVSLFVPVTMRDCSITTRSETNLDVIIPNMRLEFSRKGYGYRGPWFWNLLDREIKSAKTFNQFKRNLDVLDMFS